MSAPVPAMARQHLSLRLKLTVWFVLVLLGIQLLLFAPLFVWRRQALRRDFDAELGESASVMVENILVAEEAWRTGSLVALVPADANFALCAVRDDAGAVVASSVPGAADVLPFTAWERVVAGPLGPVFTRIPAADAAALPGVRGPLRMVTLPFRDRSEGSFFLQAAVPSEALHESFGPLRETILYGFPVALLAALASSWWIGRRAVSPIVRLSRAAQAVTAERLGERLELDPRDAEESTLEADLNRALERVERSVRTHEEFVANVSHELKTPIAVLLTQLELLKSRTHAPDEVQQFLGHLETELLCLASTVESILELSRTDGEGKLRRDRIVPVNELVVEAVERCAPFAQSAGVRIVPSLAETAETAEEPEVAGDPELLRSALENLVRNAVRFSPPEAQVRVRVESGPQGVRLVVRDRGPGLPEAWRGRVFDRYTRAPRGEELARGTASGPKTGTGLGLSIAKKIVELHGGSLQATNERSGGCSFAICLPRVPDVRALPRASRAAR